MLKVWANSTQCWEWTQESHKYNAWWCTPGILGLSRLRQEDCLRLEETTLGYIILGQLELQKDCVNTHTMLFDLIFLKTVSYSPIWPQKLYVAHVVFELVILLHIPPKFWDSMHALLKLYFKKVVLVVVAHLYEFKANLTYKWVPRWNFIDPFSTHTHILK